MDGVSESAMQNGKARKDRTLQHPWTIIESNHLNRKYLFLLDLWWEWRARTRDLCRDRSAFEN